MPLYTKAEITIAGGSPANNPQYTIRPITAARALDTGRANNIPDNYPNTATTSGGWVWINPNYEFATELLAAYTTGTFTGGPEEVAGRGVQLRMFGELIPVPTPTRTITSALTPTPTPTATSHSSNSGGSTNTGGAGGSSASSQLASYIEAEIQFEVQTQYPELESTQSNAEVMKGLRVLSVALSRAIKKYLNENVTVSTTSLVVNANGESEVIVTPNPHAHGIVAP